MKTLNTILLAFLLLFSTGTYCQGISISVKNSSLASIFSEIQKQSSYRFVYTSEQLQGTKNVSFSLQRSPIQTVLQRCFENQPVDYSVDENFIIIHKKESSSKNQPVVSPGINVTGKVLNEQGDGLVGVTIIVKGSSIATTTNEQGAFLLRNVEPLSTLVISSIGFETMQTGLLGKTFIIIQLKTAASILDETVVKGYYNTTRRLNTGSVSKVTAEEIARQPVSNPLATLEGRVPGMFLSQNNGLPGSNFSVIIRGQNSILNGNSPLYIIDGVPFLSQSDRLTQRSSLNANSPFNSINPGDIESIEVLKDADATAIYGSRGANGVVLITTKRSRKTKTQVNAEVKEGWSKIARSITYMNTKQYLQMRREAFTNTGIIPTASNAYDLLVWDTSRYTDWKKLLIGGTAHFTDASVQFSGGDGNTRFSLNTNYFRETTVFPGNLADKRISTLLNVSHHSNNNRLFASLTTSYANDKSNLIQSDLTGFISFSPNTPALYDSTGKLKWSEKGVTFSNPLALLSQSYNGVTERLTSNALLTYNIASSLVLRVSGGYNTVSFNETSLYPIKSQNPAFNPKGSSSFGINNYKSWIIEPQAEYSTQVGTKSRLQALAGTTWQQNTNKKSILDASGYTNDNLLASVNAAASYTASNAYSDYRYQAFYGRINYSYNNEFIMNLTGRRDGSSRFGKNKQFANFGAIGAAWIFSGLKALQSWQPVLSFGKLRASYGITGNDQIGDYQYLDTWSTTRYTYQGQASLRPTRLYNENYSWEKKKSIDLAMELGFLKDRILFSATWFLSRSSNQLIAYNLPGQTGFTSIVKNFPGVVQNSGIEIEFKSKNIHTASLEWNTSFNLTVPKNKLVSFPGLASSSYASSYIIGKPLNIRLGYHYLGVDPQTGIYKFEDINHDNQINNLDYTYIGTTNPAMYGGIQNDFSFKGWQLLFLFQLVSQKGYNAFYINSGTPGGIANQPVQVLDRWQSPGDMKAFQKYTPAAANPIYTAGDRVTSSSTIITNASFARLKNLSVSRMLQGAWIKKLKVQNCTVGFQCQNLLTFTGYQGADPEN